MEAEKLELKHLTPYLPYGLRIDYGYKNPKNNTKYNFKLSGLNISKVLLFDEFKPILRPISDLTDDILKEIFNDEQLVVDRLKYAIIVKYQLMGEWFKEIIPIREVTDDRNGHLIYTAWLFIELCKRHFDVFGLIDKGLAIDINTIGGKNE